jgi:hypothetical protein
MALAGRAETDAKARMAALRSALEKCGSIEYENIDSNGVPKTVSPFALTSGLRSTAHSAGRTFSEASAGGLGGSLHGPPGRWQRRPDLDRK